MHISKAIDKISEWTGEFSAWLVIPLVAVVLIDVIDRHVFNSPTMWGYDTLWMLYSAQFMIGGAFTLLRGGHIRIDIVYGMLSDHQKKFYDLINCVVIILPPAILLTWAGYGFAADAWASGEKLSTTNWFFPAGPSKTIIPIGFFLLALQCVSEILKNFNELKNGGEK